MYYLEFRSFGMYSLNNKLKQQKFMSDKYGTAFLKSSILHDSGVAMLTCCDHVTLFTNNSGELELSQIFFCRQKYCPTCSRRKSLKAYAVGMKLFEELQGEYAFLHVVLTVRNCEAARLRDTIRLLYKESSALFRSKLCSGFKGVLRCLEISHNDERGDFHPHLHCLVAVRKAYFTSRSYVSQERLRSEWADRVGQTTASVYMSRIREPEKAIAEICKYCVKPLQLDGVPIHIYNILYTQTKHVRHMQSYGVIREALAKLKLDFENTDDVEVEYSLDEFDMCDFFEPNRRIAFSFDRQLKKYRPAETVAKLPVEAVNIFRSVNSHEK